MSIRTVLLLFVVGLLACEQVPPPFNPGDSEPPSAYDFLIAGPADSLRIAQGIPGLALGLIEGNELSYEGYFGVKSLASGEPADLETRFTLGPLSGMAPTMAVMQLVQTGRLELDAPINNYLSWEIAHPSFPQGNITLRMLLAHTSGIVDNEAVLATTFSAGDSEESLQGFLESYLLPDGSLFVPINFSAERPGKEYNYSRVGLALVAHVIESAVGIPFSVWCQTNLFAKLGFAGDGWFLANLPESAPVASPHVPVGGNLVTQPVYGYPFYPGGLLRSNVRSASRLWRALMQGGAFGGQRLYGPAEAATLTDIAYPFANSQQALGWQQRQLAGKTMWYAGGEEPGFTTAAYYDPESGNGVLVFANTSDKVVALDQLAAIMFAAAAAQ